MVTSRRNFIQTALAMGLAGCMSGRSKSKPLSAYRRGPLGKIVGELPPGRYDAHMHVYVNDEAKPEEFWAEVQRCGFNGGCLFSRWPDARSPEATPEKLMDRVIAWTSASPTLYPFYWIDPAAPDALTVTMPSSSDLAVHAVFEESESEIAVGVPNTIACGAPVSWNFSMLVMRTITMP